MCFLRVFIKTDLGFVSGGLGLHGSRLSCSVMNFLTIGRDFVVQKIVIDKRYLKLRSLNYAHAP